MTNYYDFYHSIDRENLYTPYNCAENHPAYKYIKPFIDKFDLKNKKCLEIGSGKGLFQDMVEDYTGIDIATSLEKYFKKPFYVVNPDGTYPFEDNLFDGIWNYAVHEHIPDLDQALLELKRILKPGGVVLFFPAWQCRTWAAEGYEVRPYSDFGLKGKLIKLSILLRDTVWWRSLFIFPKRIYRHFLFLQGRRYRLMLYKKITPNYDNFWLSDSDACNSIDAHDAILWFESNSLKCLSHPMHLKAFLVKSGPLIFKKS